MHVAVIGAGVFGAWSAWFLAERGHRVTLVDAYGPASGRASSADHSRVIRAGYGADEIYSRLAHAALDDWRRLERDAGERLLTISGALFMGARGDAYVRDTAATLGRLGIAVEVLAPDALRSRYPQLDVNGLGDTVVERGAGVLRARAALRALARQLSTRAAVTLRRERIQPPDESFQLPLLRTASGEQLAADAYVCACGPWLPAFLPGVVGRRIRVTRQEVLYFGIPAGDSRFTVEALPVWIDFQAGVYGIPDIDAHGFKVGIDRHGGAIDPDSADRLVDARLVDRTREWLVTRFPGLADAPLVDSRVCQYENTSSGDFIIDRHPQWSNVWIAGGGSGHGFKHGPAVGRYVAGLVDNSVTPEPRFSLTAKSTEPQRNVY